MALYAIGDLHLSLGSDKPMDVFGGAWVGYVDKLREGLSVIGPEDTTILLGDLSWALDLNGAREDFAMIAAIPGRKIIVKGNHDYWWTTAAKFYRFCEENGFPDLYLLNNNCYFYNGIALTGTRGWFFEEDAPDGSHNDKIFKRELLRLEASLRAAGYTPYYLYRQKYMSGSFENIGWCRPGTAGLYNIYMMEEMHSIVSLGGGAMTKINLPDGRLERFHNPKFPQQYLERIDDVLAQKDAAFRLL